MEHSSAAGNGFLAATNYSPRGESRGWLQLYILVWCGRTAIMLIIGRKTVELTMGLVLHFMLLPFPDSVIAHKDYH